MKRAIVALAATLLASPCALAAFPTAGLERRPALSPIEPFGGVHGPESVGVIWGYEFTPTQDLQILAFGAIDSEMDGLRTSRSIAVFETDTQNAVAELSIPARRNISRVGDYLYFDNEPILLEEGVTYDVVFNSPSGAQLANTLRENRRIDPLLGPTSFWFADSLTVQYPDQRIMFSTAPAQDINFLFVAIPEPASGVLFAVIAVLATTRRTLANV